MSDNGLTRYDEIYDEGGYQGIGKVTDGDFYLAADVDAAMAQAKREVWEEVIQYGIMRMQISDTSRQVEVIAGNVVKEALENGAIAELRGLENWCREQAAKVGT